MEKKPRLKKSGYLVMCRSLDGPKLVVTLWGNNHNWGSERAELLTRAQGMRAKAIAQREFPVHEYFLVHVKVVG